MKIFLLVACSFLFASFAAAGEKVLFESTFEDGFSGFNYIGLDWLIVEPGHGNYGQAGEVEYFAGGSRKYGLEKDLSRERVSEFYVEFDFKVDYLYELTGGCKFLKVFGMQKSPTNYANTTFSINTFDLNEFKEITYGGGTTLLERDSQSTIRYNGTQKTPYTSDPMPVIEMYTRSITEHKDREWHRFKIYMKYNDDDMTNGEYKVWLDGALRLHATNVINRHNDNYPYVSRIQFGGYNGSKENSFEPWYLTIDNVKISIPVIPDPEPDPDPIQDPEPDPILDPEPEPPPGKTLPPQAGQKPKKEK